MLLSVKEYANLMGISRQAVSLQIKEKRLSEYVNAKKVGKTYVLYIKECSLLSKLVNFLNYDNSFTRTILSRTKNIDR